MSSYDISVKLSSEVGCSTQRFKRLTNLSRYYRVPRNLKNLGRVKYRFGSAFRSSKKRHCVSCSFMSYRGPTSLKSQQIKQYNLRFLNYLSQISQCYLYCFLSCLLYYLFLQRQSLIQTLLRSQRCCIICYQTQQLSYLQDRA